MSEVVTQLLEACGGSQFVINGETYIRIADYASGGFQGWVIRVSDGAVCVIEVLCHQEPIREFYAINRNS